MTWTITGTVHGIVHFPEHPEHVGDLGLHGGEDYSARRDTFRSVGEAAAWCRAVLDGEITPRKAEPYGEILTPHTPIEWTDAQIVCDPPEWSDEDHITYDTHASTRDWDLGRAVAWTDPNPTGAPA